ncbi:hypothetical protein SEA_OPIE_69 [Gordonia phage Opie]|nr:hypothetical protein SEA_OPIE_69 [Gordonia phage Opie]
MTAPADPEDRDRVAGVTPSSRIFCPTSSCRHCGHPVAQLVTPWGPKWFHLPTHSRSSQYERYCRLRTAEPEEDTVARH